MNTGEQEISVPWIWSAQWLSTQLVNVPAEAIEQGIDALRLAAAIIIDGKVYYNGSQYAALQSWLLAEGERQLAEAKAQQNEQQPPLLEPSADQRTLARRDPLSLLDELAGAGDDQTRRTDLCIALAVACGQRSDAEARDQFTAMGALLTRIMRGDAAAIDEARQWIVQNLLAKSETQDDA